MTSHLEPTTEPEAVNDSYRDILRTVKRRDECGYPFRAIFEAAASPNAADLRHLLRTATHLSDNDRRVYIVDALHHAGGTNCSWDTPLLRAITCLRYDNVKLLLEYGMNPNGIDMDCQLEYSLRFRRVRFEDVPQRFPTLPIKTSSVGPPQTQTLPLTESELNSRFSTYSRFWIDNATPHLSLAKNGDCLHSLVMAASSTPAIFDLLLESSADASFWTTPQAPSGLPDELIPSMLCIATPLHQAISSNNIQMLQEVLKRGFNPNAQALIAGYYALTPIQHAIFMENLEAFQVLREDPRIDVAICTPGYAIHLLHFAVAQLRLDIIDALHIPLSAAESTALKHNLAHVASLPLDDTHIQLFSSKIKQSIHDLRSLDPEFHLNAAFQHSISVIQHTLLATTPDCDGPGDPAFISSGRRPFLGLPLEERRSSTGTSRRFSLPSVRHFGAQTEILKRLITVLGVRILEQPDYCHNTPLHYLACTRIVNNDLVRYVRGLKEGNAVWLRSKNRWGHTPKDLWLENVTTMEPDQCPGSRYARCSHPNIVRPI